MPDSVYKGDELRDDQTSLTITQLGPEEKFAGTVLKSLKEKIDDARKELESIEEECQEIKEEAEAEREQIVQEAREEADQIVEEAESEAEQIRSEQEAEVDEAREQGYDEGYEEAVRDAQEETAELIEQGEQILEEARRERNAFIGGLGNELSGLIEALAGRVVREYVKLDPGTIRRVVETTVDEVDDVREITIVLHPADQAIIREAVDEFKDDHPSLREINLAEDEKMERGGCRIRTEFGDLEGTVTGRIEHLTDKLLSEELVERLQSESSSEESEDVADGESVEDINDDEDD